MHERFFGSDRHNSSNGFELIRNVSMVEYGDQTTTPYGHIQEPRELRHYRLPFNQMVNQSLQLNFA